MKKLMIAVAVVCAAVLAQASTVKWNSGAVYAPNADGSLSASRLTSTDGLTLTMLAWESDSSLSSFAAGDLYKWYSGSDKTKDPFGGNLSAINGATTMNTSGSSASATGVLNLGDNGETVYGAVLFVLSDGDKDVWYMENAGSVTTAKSVKSLGNLASKVGGTGSATAWTAVPEPTSGLLLLLGMAGLALKRKRA